ncbi:hypothetical protein P3342_007237 [Pyrenophora teres f. teres]|uniref:Uncharacterized protein n=1 Tax=Pyrenophora teres f. teres TaxID=97479 RepID=A0A6S6W1Q7_9PLEO|nr:hypothetical protein HRS9139_05719 [Pyrenophora teres f. teres]KAE8840328.1 hypothetical protein PTNB85_03727 [Pyrenophora teres f. teres]KAE8863827.1 hypothetical protein PTNB29_03791 [Pyrenophora teres f. teres]KAE8866625.1 hypothetical protein PTNB73_04719 [Pyrenophora teres f. teres]KAK1913991.1 hypothetical protein P3342_007237 [Pyrenophora teres f. teres]
MLLRAEIRKQTYIRCKTNWGTRAAINAAKLSLEKIEEVMRRARLGLKINDGWETDLQGLIDQVRTVTGDVAGTASARQNDRRQLFATNVQFGTPHIRGTLNPAETDDRLTLKLCGIEIDLDEV